ncbi:MAG: peptide-methionine (S)-S-oxide reductase MsrA [Candidatus Nanohaloarchaea archaeon]
MTGEIVLGGGCFWCTEAAFKEVEGVKQVTSGYAGGETEDPSYREVCSGDTGHAEVVRVEFDPGEVSLRELLDLFFRIHDPTQKDRQGPDVGTQYRSIVLYRDTDQKQTVEEVLEEVRERHEEEVHTKVKELDRFYPAEEKHQDYFEKHPEDAYCTTHAQPKVEKAREFMDPE